MTATLLQGPPMASSDLKVDKSSFAPLSGGRKKFRTWTHGYALGGRMTHWTASVVAVLLAGFPGVASAQVNCEAIPHGPARTDCYLGLSQFYRGQSDLAAARARAIRRRVVSGNYRNRPSETQTTSATIKAQTIPARPAGDRKNFDHAPPTFDLISPNPGQPQSRRR